MLVETSVATSEHESFERGSPNTRWHEFALTFPLERSLGRMLVRAVGPSPKTRGNFSISTSQG